MGYTRRRAVLCQIDQFCVAALVAYGDCASALQAGDARRFWRSLGLLSAAADQLDRLVRAEDTAEWLGIPANSIPRGTHRQTSADSFAGVPLPHCAWFLDSDGLPALLTAVAELGQLAEDRLAALQHVI